MPLYPAKIAAGKNSPVVHTFPNGLRLVYESPNAKLPQTYIRAFCHVGSINEPPSIRGAAHFIEHMCFKGSRHFPSSSAVNGPFGNSGAFFNASTDKQYTVYKINCLDSHVQEFLRILGDMMLLSKFDKVQYKRELNVVREEVKMQKPESYVEKLLFSGTPYANWIDHKSFHSAAGCLPYDEVVDFYHKYYTPQNMVISVVSSIPFSTILINLTSTQFAKPLPPPKQISPILNSVLGTVSSACESKYTFQSNENEVTRVEIGVRVCDQFNSEEYHILNVLVNILTGSMSSVLFTELREKRGLTYNSGANMILYEPAGVFIIHATSDTARLIKDGSKPGVIPVLFGIIEDLISRGVRDRDFTKAKTQIKEQLKMNSIADITKCGYNGVRVMLHNETEILTNDQIYDKCYKSIKKSDVNEIIQKYFAPKQFYFSVVGGKLPKKSDLTRFLEK